MAAVTTHRQISKAKRETTKYEMVNEVIVAACEIDNHADTC